MSIPNAKDIADAMNAFTEEEEQKMWDSLKIPSKYHGGSMPKAPEDNFGPFSSGHWSAGDTLPTAECQHEAVDVGFRFSKLVCKHCDKDMG